MQTIKIGIQDKERTYCLKLADFLNQKGEGRWKAMAFTETDALKEYLEKRQMDILVGTDGEELLRIKRQQKEMSVLWLSEKTGSGEAGKQQIGGTELFVLGRYQSAKEIYKSIRRMVEQKRELLQEKIPLVAVYSPVGRCGKTTLALKIVREHAYESWLYVGMEDYNGLPENMEGMKQRADDFLYFLKERLTDRLLLLLKESEGIIPTAFSFLDTRQIVKEDIFWLREEVKKQGIYKGILFDLGTGVLQELEQLNIFDCLLVPYLEERCAMAKRQKLEELLHAQGMEDIRERMIYLNMDNAGEVDRKIKGLMKG
ncbi:MAG: hypothetical protein NC300_09230 [Bacteroidales bacterium]|nr:hypothetical protein [Clostridium sp.]MCM1204312.1 hypothetical protein [Bacteroidales bacterium]